MQPRTWKPLSYDDVSDYINYMREAAGWTLAELARRLFIHYSTLKHYVYKRVLPKDPESFCQRIREVVIAEIKRKREEETACT